MSVITATSTRLGYTDPHRLSRYAAQTGDIELLEALLDGVVATPPTSFVQVMADAAAHGHWICIKSLLDRGGELTEVLSYGASYAAVAAIEHGHLGILKELNQDLRTTHIFQEINPAIIDSLKAAARPHITRWYIDALSDPFVREQTMEALGLWDV